MPRRKKPLPALVALGEALQKAAAAQSAALSGSPQPPAWTDPHPEIVTLPGRDHRSLLLFLQTVEANDGGDVRHAATRGCMPGCPNRMRDKRAAMAGAEFDWGPKCGTRYDDGRVDADSDDWDCLNDLEDWVFIVNRGTGFQPVVALTDKGHAHAAQLIRDRGRRTRQEGTMVWPGTSASDT